MARKKVILLFLAAVFVCFSMQTAAFAAEGGETGDTPAKKSAYPIKVEEKIEQGYNVIIKTYALGPEEDPDTISAESFTLYDSLYVLSDIIKKDNTTEESMEHTEVITVDTQKNDLESILKELSPEILYNDSGYEGILKLDISTVKCEVAGYKTSSSTATRTREYPHLSSNDTSLIPKSITEGGLTYSLVDVQFKVQGTNSVDYESVPTSYTAVAKYSTSVSSKNVTGYTTTAVYTGTISKILLGQTIYTAKFIGDKVVIPTPEPEPTPEPTTEASSGAESSTENPKPEKPAQPKEGSAPNLLPILLTVICLLAAFGGGLLAYFLINRYNVTVFNQTGREYKKLCKLKLDTKAPEPVINLNIVTPAPDSGNFVIELSSKSAKALEGKEIRVLYGMEEIVHYIDHIPRRAKYQFEAKFDSERGTTT